MLVFFVGGMHHGDSEELDVEEAPEVIERKTRPSGFQTRIEIEMGTGKEAVRYRLNGQGQGWAVYMID